MTDQELKDEIAKVEKYNSPYFDERVRVYFNYAAEKYCTYDRSDWWHPKIIFDVAKIRKEVYPIPETITELVWKIDYEGNVVKRFLRQCGCEGISAFPYLVKILVERRENNMMENTNN